MRKTSTTALMLGIGLLAGLFGSTWNTGQGLQAYDTQQDVAMDTARQPHTTLVETPGGLTAEVVRVGGNCVVAVWRRGSASGDPIAAVPCQE